MDAAPHRKSEATVSTDVGIGRKQINMTSPNPSLLFPVVELPAYRRTFLSVQASILLPLCELFVWHVMDAVPGSWLPEVSVQIVTF